MPYLYPVETEVTIEKLDKVGRTLSEKLKTFAKFFGILTGWCIFNLIFMLFVSRARSLSLDSYRMLAEGLHSLATEDIFFIFTLIFDDRIVYFITLAMVFASGVTFFVILLNLGSDSTAATRDGKRSKASECKLYGEAYVVSYKQQVAFLS